MHRVHQTIARAALLAALMAGPAASAAVLAHVAHAHADAGHAEHHDGHHGHPHAESDGAHHGSAGHSHEISTDDTFATARIVGRAIPLTAFATLRQPTFDLPAAPARSSRELAPPTTGPPAPSYPHPILRL